MVVTEHIGDIFAAPEGSVLIHSNNCQGDWGSGVAAAFKAKFPAAYQIYHDHCTIPGSTHVKKLLLGTCLLIPPQAADIPKSGRYWIACLMTSLHYGRRVDKPEAILENTRHALTAMRAELQKAERAGAGVDFAGKLYTVRMNGKAFRTPWPLTRRVLANSRLDVKVMNNVDVMDAKERAQVLAQMEQSGDDLAKVRALREDESDGGAAKNEEVSKGEQGSEKVQRVKKSAKRKSGDAKSQDVAEAAGEKAGERQRKKHKSSKQAT